MTHLISHHGKASERTKPTTTTVFPSFTPPSNRVSDNRSCAIHAQLVIQNIGTYAMELSRCRNLAFG